MFHDLDIMEVATINNTVVNINLIQCKVNFNYMAQLAHLISYLSIIDGGADSHVLGASWIKLFTVYKGTPMADVFGFTSQTARKHNLSHCRNHCIKCH